jgi:SAM-dependent methyltransferase
MCEVARDLSLRTAFDGVAELYDEMRPRYPEALIEDVVSLSGIPPGGSILEIGCGPGTATLPFARRGYAMLCLELGPHLAARAAAKCTPYPGVHVQVCAFEDWPLQPRAFDLVLSASAFHWIPVEVGYAKAAAALKDGGSLALCWNRHREGDTPLYEAMQDFWQEQAPEVAERARRRPSSEESERRTLADIEASGLFGEVVVCRYSWRQRYTAEQYGKLSSTYSGLASLAEERRRDLQAGLAALVERHGGTVERPYETVLYIAGVRKG